MMVVSDNFYVYCIMIVMFEWMNEWSETKILSFNVVGQLWENCKNFHPSQTMTCCFVLWKKLHNLQNINILK